MRSFLIHVLSYSLLIIPMLGHAGRCREFRNASGTLTRISCVARSTELSSGRFTTRQVLWQLPTGTAPADGWPAVVLSQGSWFPVEFTRVAHLPMGGFNEVRLIQTLLDNGYAVIAPRATLRVGWTTNLPLPDYAQTSDYEMFTNLLARIRQGGFGRIDVNRLYATGVSSGGYNTSRLALTFPGVFRAIAIESASYATCLGPICRIPDSLPQQHPPTLLLHGARDLIVPISTAKSFYALLKREGIETEFVVDDDFGHGWLDQAPEKILDWFERF